MRISDWSSDVCSSDLGLEDLARRRDDLCAGLIGLLEADEFGRFPVEIDGGGGVARLQRLVAEGLRGGGAGRGVDEVGRDTSQHARGLAFTSRDDGATCGGRTAPTAEKRTGMKGGSKK